MAFIYVYIHTHTFLIHIQGVAKVDLQLFIWKTM